MSAKRMRLTDADLLLIVDCLGCVAADDLSNHAEGFGFETTDALAEALDALHAKINVERDRREQRKAAKS